MKRLVLRALIVLIFLGTAQVGFAQSALVLSINRDFGYGGFDNKIEGLFSLTVTGPEDLTTVDFYINNEMVGTVEQPPFHLQFSTNSYSPGEHRIYAVGHTLTEGDLQSNEIIRIFLSKDESRGAALGLIVPMIGIVFVVMTAVAVIPALFGRKEKVGDYGRLGGTVCPKCGLPFSLRIFGINWFGGKLQRCPHCGRWSVVRRTSPIGLAAAEARWRGETPDQFSAEDREQRTQRQIDDSRYEK